MKHVGLNVAADTFMTAAYTGVGGGLVILTADDPGMHSSQNEQDSRAYARMAGVPLLEPSNSAEAKEFTLLAFTISEEFDTPRPGAHHHPNLPQQRPGGARRASRPDLGRLHPRPLEVRDDPRVRPRPPTGAARSPPGARRLCRRQRPHHRIRNRHRLRCGHLGHRPPVRA